MMLPLVAFELISGPWRRTWVRFGYDPTSDPRARFLQVFDIKKHKAQGEETQPKTAAQKRAPAAMQLCDLRYRKAQ